MLFYDSPKILQGVGGVFNKWFARFYFIGLLEQDKGQYDHDELYFDYILGASMFVNKDFIKEVGMMSEDYFLYYEEVDWCIRAKKAGWQVGYCYASRIFHKQGVSTGSNIKMRKKDLVSEYYKIRNLINLYKKFHKHLLVIAYVRIIMVFIKLILKGKIKDFFMILKTSYIRI